MQSEIIIIDFWKGEERKQQSCFVKVQKNIINDKIKIEPEKERKSI